AIRGVSSRKSGLPSACTISSRSAARIRWRRRCTGCARSSRPQALMCRSVLCAVWAILPPDRGSMRAPSLLRALVVRLTIVVVLALAGIFSILYFEFRDGLMGLDGQSIAVQVQDLRDSIVSGASPPRLELPRSLQEFYANPDSLNGYQV